MKISIITTVFNNKEFIEDCIKSILEQSYENIEYIIIDGASTDGTIEIIKKYNHKISKWISEPDSGMYDALNKGIRIASGDVIGFLHADDFYAHGRVIENVMDTFRKENIDACYGNLQYVSKEDKNRVIRHWKSSIYKNSKFRYGWHPPHPTLFIKKEIYNKFGYFNTSLSIAADYELMLRFFEKYKISTSYIPQVLIKMRLGGKSNKSLKNILIQTYEDYKAWKLNGLNGGFVAVLLKKFSKVPQFLKARNSQAI